MSRSWSKSRFAQDGFGYSFSLKVKCAMFRARSSKVSVQKVSLCPFQCKPRRSGVSLESPGLENIPQNSGKSSRSSSKSLCAQDGFGYSFSLKVKCAMFRARSSKVSVQKVSLCLFQCKPRRSGVSLELPGLENIPQVPGNRAELGQNYDARKEVSATISVLK